MTKIISYQKQRKCIVNGCKGFGRNKGFYKGKTRYDRVCEMHHRLRHGFHGFYEKRNIDNKKCEICGWDKAFCDRHRINPKLGYAKENVKVLCPNCHRLITIGLLNT